MWYIHTLFMILRNVWHDLKPLATSKDLGKDGGVGGFNYLHEKRQ